MSKVSFVNLLPYPPTLSSVLTPSTNPNSEMFYWSYILQINFETQFYTSISSHPFLCHQIQAIKGNETFLKFSLTFVKFSTFFYIILVTFYILYNRFSGFMPWCVSFTLLFTIFSQVFWDEEGKVECNGNENTDEFASYLTIQTFLDEVDKTYFWKFINNRFSENIFENS